MANESAVARLGERAIVIGAGMGGMMAAEVLSRFFDHVIVLDKDTLPAAPEPRRGVPQGHHVHTLLVQGRINLDRLFPGFSDELLARGATWARNLVEFRVHDAAGWFPGKDLDMHLVTSSRPLTEGTVRTFLARNPKVEIRDETTVDGLQLNGQTVSGVTIGGAEGPEVLSAELVIDASGRAGKSLPWLEAAGFGPVEETTIEIGVAYASAIFRKPADWKHGVESIVFGSDPKKGERSAGVFSIEDNCWLVTLIGRFHQVPSTDPEKFMAYAKSLEDSTVYDWISQGERITPIRLYRPHFSKWRRYDRLERYPDGLLPLGDAIAQVNPARGQGMTLASTHAVSLLDVLAERAASGDGIAGIAKPYFDKVQGFTQTVWEALETLEYQYDGVNGDQPADLDMRIAFTNGLRALANEDTEVLELMLRVGHLMAPPEVLQRADIIERVLARAH